MLVAESDTVGIVGFISGGKNPVNDVPNLEPYNAQLYAIYVLQAFQQNGIGKLLKQSLTPILIERGYQSMFLWALTDNISARRFYETMGAKHVYEETKTMGRQEISESVYCWEDRYSLEKK